MTQNTCFSGDCKWRKQGSDRVHCSHPNAIKYRSITETCSCGRKPNEIKGGCGKCIGRGSYVYPWAYEACDCGGYERK